MWLQYHTVNPCSLNYKEFWSSKNQGGLKKIRAKINYTCMQKATPCTAILSMSNSIGESPEEKGWKNTSKFENHQNLAWEFATPCTAILSMSNSIGENPEEKGCKIHLNLKIVKIWHPSRCYMKTTGPGILGYWSRAYFLKCQKRQRIEVKALSIGHQARIIQWR